MRVALNIYVAVMLLVFFAAGMAIANRLHTLHETSHQVERAGKSGRL